MRRASSSRKRPRPPTWATPPDRLTDASLVSEPVAHSPRRPCILDVVPAIGELDERRRRRFELISPRWAHLFSLRPRPRTPSGIRRSTLPALPG